MTAEQQLFDELTAAIRRQPDCASLARYGGHIKALIAANQGTREEITPEMYGLLRTAYAERKREIEAQAAQAAPATVPSENKTAIALAAFAACRNSLTLISIFVDFEVKFIDAGENMPPEIEAAYEQRKLELERDEAARAKLGEFGLNLDAAQALGATPAGAASTAGGANDFPYCE